MTWIYDDNGRRWVEPVPRKRRAYPKAGRFADVKVGDWLEGGSYEKFLMGHNGRKPAPIYSVITDHWFDPVLGETHQEKGMMFAVARLTGLDRETGEPKFTHKYAHTRRGLASQGYRYSEAADPVATLQATFQGVREGSVTLMSRAKRAPKLRPLGLL